ncbi:MAG: MotA/TolQ/ExbB proton channel family protein [Planctomycetota bacterium]
MHTRLGWLTAMVAMLALVIAAAPVPGQPDSATPSSASATDGSFASAFFISYRTDPGGRRSVEIIGSLVIWFLLVLSTASIGLIGSMALTNQRKSIFPPDVYDSVSGHIQAGRYREAMALTKEDPSFFGQILHAALTEASHGFGAVIRRLELTSDELTTVRLRRIEYLNVLGQVSPMIGLFGTVYGMILAFRAIVISGGNADPILLAGGIGTALTTTFWGLVVAIPALAGYAIIRNRIDEFTTEATLRAEELLNQFRPRATPRPNPVDA